MGKIIEDIAVVGAGAWGTALAQILSSAGRRVTLYARDPALAQMLNVGHENLPYLPGEPLNKAIRATADPAEAVGKAGLVLLVTPAQHLRATLKKFLPFLPPQVPLIQAAKGIEISTGFLMSEVAAETAPGHPYAALSGPTFATEAVKGLPTAITLATSAEAATALHWAESIRGKAFRPYVSADPVGVEIAGALKNVIAIACGIVEGMRFGENAKMAVMTRGLAEARRLGVKRGARPETFLGLAGVGDLALTCSSMTSRNFSLGFELGQGRSLAEIMKTRRSVAEGVTTASAVAGDAARQGVDMPISFAVQAVLTGKETVKDVVAGLLSRNLKPEAE